MRYKESKRGHCFFVFLNCYTKKNLFCLWTHPYSVEMNYNTSIIAALRHDEGVWRVIRWRRITLFPPSSVIKCVIQLTLDTWYFAKLCFICWSNAPLTCSLCAADAAKKGQSVTCSSLRWPGLWSSPPLEPGWRARPPWVKWGVKERIDSICRGPTLMKNRLCQLTLTAGRH